MFKSWCPTLYPSFRTMLTVGYVKHSLVPLRSIPSRPTALRLLSKAFSVFIEMIMWKILDIYFLSFSFFLFFIFI